MKREREKKNTKEWEKSKKQKSVFKVDEKKRNEMTKIGKEKNK